MGVVASTSVLAILPGSIALYHRFRSQRQREQEIQRNRGMVARLTQLLATPLSAPSRTRENESRTGAVAIGV